MRVAPVPMFLKRKRLLQSKDKLGGVVRIDPELHGNVRFRSQNFRDDDFGIRSI